MDVRYEKEISITMTQKYLLQFLQDREDAVQADYEQGLLDEGLVDYPGTWGDLFLYAYTSALADVRELWVEGVRESARLPRDYPLPTT